LIDVSVESHRIHVELDPNYPYYQRAYILVRSLLSSYEVDHNKWAVSYQDFLTLHHHLDMLGLVEGRTMTEDAYQWIEYLNSCRRINESLKSGAENQRIKQDLEGKLKSELYEDQVTAVALGVRNRRWGIFDEMGCGKSAQALATVVALGNLVGKTLIICPRTVHIDFSKEIRKHTYLKAEVIPAGRKRALEWLQLKKNSDFDVLLVHPENLVGGKGKKNVFGDLTRLLRSMTWDMVIVDEFHMYKNVEAKRTQCVLSLLQDSKDRANKRPRALLLTGTPVPESPMNSYVALRILSQDVIPHISRFENHFVVRQQIQYGKKGKFDKITGYQNLDELKRLIEVVSIRRTKDEMRGFPEKVFMVRNVHLSGKQLALYRVICGDILAQLPEDSRINIDKFLSSATQTLRLRQLLNHPALLDESGDSAKYVVLDNILEELLADPEQKVVVWTEFRKAVELLQERYDKLYGAVKVYGGVSNESLEEISWKFVNEDHPRIVVATPAKAGSGVDWLARARTGIYIERPYSFTLYTQSLDRLHRRVVENPTSRIERIRAKPATLMFLDVPNSVDELARDSIQAKQNMSDALTTKNEKLVEMGREELLKYLR